LRDRGAIGNAIAVTDRGGELRFWFVPVVVDDQIAGYFRVGVDLSDLRWSSFQRRPDTLAGCPPATLWLDTEVIRGRALSLAHPGEVASAPRLSFDRIPDRIAWLVRLETPAGEGRDVFIAGYAVWPASKEGTNSYE
jgi:hypothetical protein